MRKLILSVLSLSALIFTGCFKDDDTPIIIEEITIINEGGGNNGGNEQTEIVPVTGAITASTIWTADKIYQLNQKVVVTDGVTLTIEAGTII